MHRIDSDGHDNNLFVDEDVNNAIAGTKMAADWLNAIQEELINILVLAGISPDKPTTDQLAQAFNLLGGSKDWSDILNKPATFPPLAHGHPYSAITDLPELPIGVDQTWVDYSSSGRNANQMYMNSTGRSIVVIVSNDDNTNSDLIDGVVSMDDRYSRTYIIPDGGSYKIISFLNWMELR